VSRRISLIVPLCPLLFVLRPFGFDRLQLNCYPPPQDMRKTHWSREVLGHRGSRTIAALL